MRSTRLNRRLCFWNLTPSTDSRQRLSHRPDAPKSGSLRHSLSRLAPNFPYRRGLLALTLLLPATTALAGPSGEQVTGGAATITRPNSVTTQITQQTNKAIIDWQNFSIGQQELVRFQQPGADSIALNRVLGNDPSRIYGNLTANGQVFLVNPGGVLFGPTSQVSVHGLLATTRDISNDDFLAGRYTFTSGLNPYLGTEVVSQGSLLANDGGYIVLAGDYTANAGVISARLGQVVLASGNRFTLDLHGDQLIGLAVDEASLAQHAGVENFGAIGADGGQVVMTARVAKELASTVVNNTGLVQARSIEDRNGEIILHGGSFGTVASSGTLDASGRGAGESGGRVRMLGEKVGLFDLALVDVSGANGGGTALIGGDYQGQPMQLPLPFTGEGWGEGLPNAHATYLGKDTAIKADAIDNGDGGRVIVWADDTTRAYGSISAKGGANSGDGGLVETSGHWLDATQAPDLSASMGRGGVWLLDPNDINIVHSENATPDSQISGGSPFTPTQNDTSASTLSDYTINQALFSGSVTITTSSANLGTGDITFDASGGAITISNTSGTNRTLDLFAANDIKFIGGTTTFNSPSSTTSLEVGLHPTGVVSTQTGASVVLDGTAGSGMSRAWLDAGKSWDNYGQLTLIEGAAVHLDSGAIFHNKTTGVVNSGGTTGWAFWSNPNDDGIIDNDGVINITKGTAFEAAFNQTSTGVLNVVDNGASVQLNLQNAGSIEGTINLKAGSVAASCWVNEYHGTAASFTNTSFSGNGGTLYVAGSVGGTPTASFNNVIAANTQLNVGSGGNAGNVTITGNSTFSGVGLSTGTLALNNGILNINGNFTVPAGVSYTGSVGYEASGTLTISSPLSAPSYLRLGGSTLTIDDNISTIGLELIANTITVAADKSVTATGSGAGMDDSIRFTPYTSGNAITLIDSAGAGLVIDPAKIGTSGKAFNANGFEFDAGATGTVAITMPVNVPGANLAFEGGTVDVNSNVTGKNVHYLADSINFTGTPVTSAVDAGGGIGISPWTTTRPITVAAVNPGNSLWINSGVLNNTTPQFIADYLVIGTSTINGTPYNSGPISINAPITGTTTTFKNLDLTTSGAITQSAAITLPAYNATTCPNCGSLKVLGGSGNITLEDLGNSIDSFGATLSGGNLSFTNSRSFTVGGIETVSSDILLAALSGGDITVEAPGIDGCYGITSDCASTVTLSAGGSINTPLIRATTVYLYAIGNVVDTDGGLNNIVSGNSGSSVTLNYEVEGSIDLDAWGATPGGMRMAGTDKVRWAQPVVEPPPPPPPTIDQCTADPTLAGCTAVLPTLSDCITNPATPGCTAVLPSLATCTTDPTLPGCSVVLPPLAECTANPALPGCTAVLPNISTCTTDPTLPGCAVVLPPLAECTANPALPGCTAVLPNIAACTVTPTLPGCAVVLPPLAACIATPALPGCTAVLPSIDTCTATPTAPGCTAVLPSLAVCTMNPAAPGCTAVLPPLTECTATPALPGCTAVLPSIDTCTATPTAPGCTAVLPPLATCATDPTLPGCTAVLPLPPSGETPTQILDTIQAVILVDLVMPTAGGPMPEQPAPSSGPGTASGNDDKERRAEEVPLTTASQELPLARQPIFDLGGGGVAGQNMVCK